jgi:hypothetical protein
MGQCRELRWDNPSVLLAAGRWLPVAINRTPTAAVAVSRAVQAAPAVQSTRGPVAEIGPVPERNRPRIIPVAAAYLLVGVIVVRLALHAMHSG